MESITTVDLFAGAGGTSTGLVEAAGALSSRVNLTAINHNRKALETHQANFPWRNIYSQSSSSWIHRKWFRRDGLTEWLLLLNAPFSQGQEEESLSGRRTGHHPGISAGGFTSWTYHGC